VLCLKNPQSAPLTTPLKKGALNDCATKPPFHTSRMRNVGRRQALAPAGGFFADSTIGKVKNA